jgi:DNA modification methylase
MSIQANALYQADCLALLERIESERVQLMSEDEVARSKELQVYLLFMSRVVQQAHRVLANSGNLLIHLESGLSSYIRLILDQVFGREHFQQEIVWPSSPISISSKPPASSHDVIFHYSKTDSFTYSPPHRPLADRETGRYTKSDERGRYRLSSLDSPALGSTRRFEWKGFVPPVGRSWRYSKGQLDRFYREGKIDTEGEFPGLRIYSDETQGVRVGSVWDDIPRVSAQERIGGYFAQMPLALLHRIIRMGSEPGDLVLDPFCGSGTTLVAAHADGRRWIGCDSLEEAVAVSVQRFDKTLGISPDTDFHLGDSDSIRGFPVLHHFYSPLVLRLDQALEPTFIRGQTFHREEVIHYEFKAVTSRSPARTIRDTIERYIVCFLNAEGGYVYWGIRDSREIVGVPLSYRHRDEIRQVLPQKAGSIVPSIDPTACRIEFYPVYDDRRKVIDDHWIVELEVPYTSDKSVCYRTRNGNLYVKMDGVCSKLTGPQEAEWIKNHLET